MAQRTVTTAISDKAVHHGREHVLAPNQTAIEEGKTRASHHQNQRRAGQHPGIVASHLSRFRGSLDSRESRLSA